VRIPAVLARAIQLVPFALRFNTDLLVLDHEHHHHHDD